MDQSPTQNSPADLAAGLAAFAAQIAKAADALHLLTGTELADLAELLKQFVAQITADLTPAVAALAKTDADAAAALQSQADAALDAVVDLAGKVRDSIAQLAKPPAPEPAATEPAQPPARDVAGTGQSAGTPAAAPSTPRAAPATSPGGPLPNFPSPGEAGALSDAAKDLRRQLDAVAEAMGRMKAEDADGLEAELKKIAEAAEKTGPELAKLFQVDPAAARRLRDQMQAVVDQAGKMGRAVRQKADDMRQAKAESAKKEAADQAAKADKDARADKQKAAQNIGKAAQLATGGAGNSPTHGLGALAGGAIGGAIDPAGGEVVGAAIGAAFDQAATAIQNATDALSGFIASSVQAANPGVWERYQRSVQDFGAIFGNALAPLIEMMRDWTDKLNGVLSSIAPIIADAVQEIVADLAPVINAVIEFAQTLAQSFRDMAKVFGPIFSVAVKFAAQAMELFLAACDAVMDVLNDLFATMDAAGDGGATWTSVWQKIGEAIQVVTKVVKDLIYVMAELAKQFAKTGTMDVPKAVKDAAANQKKKEDAAKNAAQGKTFAARPAEFAGIEDIGKQTQLAFASQGTGPTAKPPDDNIADIAAAVAGLESFFLSWAAGVGRDISVIAEHIRNPVGSAVKDATDAVKSMAGGGSLSWDEIKQVAGF